MEFESWTDYQRFWGSSSSESPEATLTSQAWVFTFTSASAIYVGGEAYSLTITIPDAYMDEISAPVSKRDVITLDATFYVEEDASVDYPIQIVLRNGVVGY